MPSVKVLVVMLASVLEMSKTRRKQDSCHLHPQWLSKSCNEYMIWLPSIENIIIYQSGTTYLNKKENQTYVKNVIIENNKLDSYNFASHRFKV